MPVDVGGIQLDVVERGRGETVVFVHGSASDRRTWEPQLGVFSQSFRAVAYSRRYHWPNQPIARGADYSMPQHVADLAGLIDALGGEAVHLVGHSYGAFVCLLLAIARPALVRSLVLTEPPVLTLFTSDPPRPTELLKLLVTRPRAGLAIARLGLTGFGPAAAAARRGDEEAALRRFAASILGRDTFSGLDPARLEQARQNFIPAELLGSGLAPLDAETIRAVSCPVLLIVGDKSPAVFHHLASGLRHLLPGAKWVEIAGASHIVHEDNAEDFNAAVSSFLLGAGLS